MERYTRRVEQFSKALTVYPVSCEPLADGRTDVQWLEGVLAGGAQIVQLRDKVSGDAKLLQKAKRFRKMTQEAGALFIINDRVDIALMAEADGVHVGQGDLPPAEIRKIAPELLIGLSCNSREDVAALVELGQAETNPVSYFNIGPLYATATKDGLQDFLGPGVVGEFSALCPLPFSVMGGIKEQHVEELVKAGAQRIAVVTALSQATDIERETAKWMKMITSSQ
ncbi:MAG TPA: thiamine phosphate synthase [Desulfopila sp.]|nr:thiamine phosphate synthase [Desulfopila sp.]